MGIIVINNLFKLTSIIIDNILEGKTPSLNHALLTCSKTNVIGKTFFICKCFIKRSSYGMVLASHRFSLPRKPPISCAFYNLMSIQYIVKHILQYNRIPKCLLAYVVPLKLMESKSIHCH